MIVPISCQILVSRPLHFTRVISASIYIKQLTSWGGAGRGHRSKWLSQIIEIGSCQIFTTAPHYWSLPILTCTSFIIYLEKAPIRAFHLVKSVSSCHTLTNCIFKHNVLISARRKAFSLLQRIILQHRFSSMLKLANTRHYTSAPSWLHSDCGPIFGTEMLFTSHGVTTAHWQLEDAAEVARTFTRNSWHKGITTKCSTINNNKGFSVSVHLHLLTIYYFQDQCHCLIEVLSSPNSLTVYTCQKRLRWGNVTLRFAFR